jgi:hypothetical protein
MSRKVERLNRQTEPSSQLCYLKQICVCMQPLSADTRALLARPAADSCITTSLISCTCELLHTVASCTAALATGHFPCASAGLTSAGMLSHAITYSNSHFSYCLSWLGLSKPSFHSIGCGMISRAVAYGTRALFIVPELALTTATLAFTAYAVACYCM